MNKLKIKESYLLLLIVVSLVSLGIYTTYALFTASTTINDVVGITATLDIGKSMSEYEVVTVQPNETKLIELNVVNSYNDNIYYGAWYQIVKGNSDNIQIGLYTERNNNPGSGTLASNTSINLLVGITNNNSTSITVYIGVKGSLTNELNLSSDKILIPDGFSEALLVTPEVLEEHKVDGTGITINREFSATGAVQNVTLNAGTYKLEVWGAQGGSYDTSYEGGKGGYSYGTLTLTDTTNLYVYVGKQGTGTGTSVTGLVSGGFNGGGNGYSSSTTYLSSAGGGASDIRIGQDSLYARVIVAGGGGGAGSYNASNHYSGGSGGGESGSSGGQSTALYKGGLGGSQTSAGSSYYGITENSTNSSYGTLASFGVGASGNSSSGVAGGGGGWYGGGYGRRAAGGGGSGYVYTSSTASNYPSGNLLNSAYYLTDAATIGGNTSFVSTNGGTETGHSGDGYAKITGTIKPVYSIPAVFGLTDVSLKLSDSFDLMSGVTIECSVGDNSCLIIETSISDWRTLPNGTSVVYYIVEDGNGNRYKYPRNITVESLYEYTSVGTTELTLNIGTYKLEVWGSQGSSSQYNPGGRGGYSYGTLSLSNSTNIFVCVGGINGSNGGGTGGSQSWITNGVTSSSNGVQSGGGTDIRIGTDSLYARVIVAGGGSGATYRESSNGNVTYNSGNPAVGERNYGYSFGIGENGERGGPIVGGGGGWYGGNSGNGGSGYVYTSSTAANYPSGCLLNSSYYLTDALTLGGNTSFTDFDGTTVTGHDGNGAVRITKLN